jgi:hypothetical protein
MMYKTILQAFILLEVVILNTSWGEIQVQYTNVRPGRVRGKYLWAELSTYRRGKQNAVPSEKIQLVCFDVVSCKSDKHLRKPQRKASETEDSYPLLKEVDEVGTSCICSNKPSVIIFVRFYGR